MCDCRRRIGYQQQQGERRRTRKGLVLDPRSGRPVVGRTERRMTGPRSYHTFGRLEDGRLRSCHPRTRRRVEDWYSPHAATQISGIVDVLGVFQCGCFGGNLPLLRIGTIYLSNLDSIDCVNLPQQCTCVIGSWLEINRTAVPRCDAYASLKHRSTEMMTWISDLLVHPFASRPPEIFNRDMPSAVTRASLFLFRVRSCCVHIPSVTYW